MIKRILGTIAILLLLTTLVISREKITPEEKSTVDVLMQMGVIDTERTELELNQPMPTIDAMSMELKGIEYTKIGMIARDTEIIKKFSSQIESLTDDIVSQEKMIAKQKKDIKTLKDEQDNKDKIYAVVGMILFIIGIAN
jgi:glucose uptake protein GlcU